ncbi:MAG TPA: glycoside hydrolase family 31 protein, partial [Bacilli bacterium]|nr:glycoside hydrolase family 31 protein [Bacilli bacterium]
DPELYMRYVQLGTFSPIFRFSSAKGHYYKREPWRWDVKTSGITTDYCQLRQRLIPYLYAEAYKYHKTGLPLIQPLYYKYPKIKDEPMYRNEYFFGTELFVAPITSPKDKIMNRAIHRIFIPNGMWYDFKTGKKFPGGKRYITFFQDENYPVFAKSGSIIPLANLEQNKNVCKPPRSMEIHVFPGLSNTYKLYEDDGESNLYKDGYYIVTNIDYNYQENNYTLIIRPTEGKSGIIPDKRDYKIRFRNTKEADEVIIYIDENKVNFNAYPEDSDFVIEIKDVPTTKQLTINCKGKDIEIDAVRIINEEIDSIISDLQIRTVLKEKIAEVIYSDKTIQKKRIALRKLKKDGLDKIYIRMFLKLLEYIAEI